VRLRATKPSSSSSSVASTTSSTAYNCTYPIWRVKNQSALNYTDIISSGKTYTDSLFVANSDALYWSKYNLKILNTTSGITWSRAITILKNATIFGNVSTGQVGLNSSDVIQGTVLNDGYYLSGLSALSTIPNLLANTILTPTYSSSGIFAANVFIKGIPTLVTVDDYLPFAKGVLASAK
jgi:hypothetical protein